MSVPGGVPAVVPGRFAIPKWNAISAGSAPAPTKPHVSAAQNTSNLVIKNRLLVHQHQQFIMITSCFCYTNTSSLVGTPYLSATPTPTA